jgi:flagellar hook-basal body complex protein FliE
MNVTDIKDVSLFPSEKIFNRQHVRHDPISDFKEILTRSVNEVNELAAESNRSVEQMLLGKTDIHQAMIAMEKAGISFSLLLQVRNKIITAYEEIMRMQF